MTEEKTLSVWTLKPVEDKIEMIIAAYPNVRPTADHLATYIGNQLGCVISRGSIIGLYDRKKKHLERYPLEGRNYSSGEKKPLTRTSRLPKTRPAPSLTHLFTPKEPPLDIPRPEPLRKTTLQLEARDCRWIVEGEGEAARYCADRTPMGSSWCDYHRRLVYGRGTESERTAVNVLKSFAR